MAVLETLEMGVEETLRAQVFIARNRAADLEAQLSAVEDQLQQMQKRLTLTKHEKEILNGHTDGCIRIGELWSLIHRVFGEAAHR